MKNNKKKTGWRRPRHTIISMIAAPFFWLFVLIKYGVAVRPFRDRKRQYLVLMNHQTSSDQFFAGLTFYKAMYYVASEDIFSNGLVSHLLNFALKPIPINKSAADMRAIINCIKVAKEGGTIVMAPEGNRTYSGKTCYIKPSVVALIRKLGLPVAFFKIEGGYGVQPRWTDRNRRGKIRFGVSEVLEPEAYANLTDEELYSEIVRQLDVNEASVSGKFRSKHAAEYIERMLYVCPDCGLTSFHSEGNFFTCRKCGRVFEYTETKEIVPVSGSCSLRFAADFYDYQENFVRSLDLSGFTETPAYTDSVKIFAVELCKSKKKVSPDADLRLFGDRIEITSLRPDLRMEYGFDAIKSITLLGRNKMNVRTNDGLWQIKGAKSFNALKYLNFYSHYKAQKENSNDGIGKPEFLGL